MGPSGRAVERVRTGSGRAFRALAVFWVLVALIAGSGAATLQWLGPKHFGPVAAGPTPDLVAMSPERSPLPNAEPAGREPAQADKIRADQAAEDKGHSDKGHSDKAKSDRTMSDPKEPDPNSVQSSGAILAPSPELQEAAPNHPESTLPRIGPDGLAPMRAYAARTEPDDGRPRVALLLAGIGAAELESEGAIRKVPAPVSLAISPYSFHPERLLGVARDRGHEYLLSLPMEPQSYPLDDPGDEALMTGLTAAINHDRLEWTLSRIDGYVGVTSALGSMHGERFGAIPELMRPVLDELAHRGLLYVDARPGAPPSSGTGRAVDVAIDAGASRDEIDAQLSRLERIARDRGSAIGVAGAPRPVMVDRISTWAAGLAARGVVLVPVSAIVLKPESPAPSPLSAK